MSSSVSLEHIRSEGGFEIDPKAWIFVPIESNGSALHGSRTDTASEIFLPHEALIIARQLRVQFPGATITLSLAAMGGGRSLLTLVN